MIPLTLLKTVKPSLALLRYLFDSLPIGLVVMDRSGRVVVYNRAEEQLAGRSRDHVLGEDFFRAIAPCMNIRELGDVFRENIGARSVDVNLEMSLPLPHLDKPRDVKIRLSSFELGDEPYGFLMVEDNSLQRSVQRMREQLQSLLVHDFKGPLAALQINLQLLEELQTIRDIPDAIESVKDALVATKRLTTMTMGLLDISRLESAEMPLRRTRVDTRQMFDRVRNDNATAARALGVHVHLRECVPATVFLDETLFVRALDNLVENAIRHARNIELRSDGGSSHVAFTVTDDGPGVPAHLIDRLFDKYVRLSDTESAVEGTNRGLGLTFVQLVVKEHGGEVTVRCPPGGGTEFTLRIPQETSVDLSP